MVWRAALLLVVSSPALADGPALAHLTINERTITLTAETTHPPLDDETATQLDLRFSQLHLGFPMPPILNVALEQRDDTWAVVDLSLDQSNNARPIVFAAHALQILEVTGDASAPGFVIAGEAMVPDQAPVSVHIEIQLSSP